MPGIVAPSLCSDRDKPSISGFNFMKEIIIVSEKYGTKSVFVDDEDYEKVTMYKWTLTKAPNTFYAYRHSYELGRKYPVSIRMHRFIMEMPTVRIDHKDRNGLNNTKSNLRLCSHSQNIANSKSRKNSISDYLGVTYDKSRSKWQAQITKDYKQYHIGRFDSEIDAAKAYDKEAIILHGEFANLNFNGL